MMQITRAADYALRAIVYVASQGDKRCIPAAEVAGKQQIPAAYISKVLQALVRAKIVATVPGRKGGVKLLRLPREISVLDIIEAVDGAVTLNRCLMRSRQCPRDAFCPIHPFWVSTRESLAKILSETKISKFVTAGTVAINQHKTD